MGDTAGAASDIPGWGCGEETPGPERIVSFLSPIDGTVTVTTTAGTLFALEGDVKGCNPDLCVGDGVLTDIAGANAAGLDSALIPGGIHGAAHGLFMGEMPDAARLAALLAGHAASPTYAIPSLRW